MSSPKSRHLPASEPLETSNLRVPPVESENVSSILSNPHSTALTNRLLYHAAQCAQRAFVRVIREKAVAVRQESAHDVAALRYVVACVLDCVGLQKIGH